MGTKPKPQPTEFDHVLNTLTGMVDVVGETRQDVKQVKEHLSGQDKAIAEIKEHLSRQDKRFDQQDKRFDQLELLIRQLIPNANN